MASNSLKPQTALLKKVQSHLETNLFLSAEEKSYWKSRLASLDRVALEGLLRILEKNQKDFKGVLTGFLEKDSQGRMVKQWKTFKRQRIKAAGDRAQQEEGQKAEREMEQQLS